MLIKEIVEGWANVVKDRFNQLDLETKKLSQDRLMICHVCDIRNGNTCDPRRKGEHVTNGTLVGGCGCNISAKTMSPDSKCPLGKW